jgi:hypothetical protein
MGSSVSNWQYIPTTDKAVSNMMNKCKESQQTAKPTSALSVGNKVGRYYLQQMTRDFVCPYRCTLVSHKLFRTRE